MGKEIRIGVDAEYVRAFSEAVEKYPEIDFRRFNPHLAVRCRIADELLGNGGTVELSAAKNGESQVDIHVNGSRVEECGALTRKGLESVIDAFSRGRGEEIAASMLNKGMVVVLNGS